MAKDNSIKERLDAEVDKRVTYYEQNPVDEKSRMGTVHYVAAIVIAVVGLVMTVLGAVMK
ncbi:MAG: hypothetical protein UHG68_01785 [Clostridia bacterium]|nr:hypothetical protein [Clostridia bacterium]